ncbi:hypothetical protein BSLG_004517 [Batrachochytrium salamandrivorans]|nr:hypothetical protein BSLG_004517 [Batrachochytrium salamandrivorans]
MAGDDGLRHWLTNIDTYGIGFVSGVPVTAEATEKLGRRISFIRETHYGRFWDFSPNMEHGDTAYTSLGLGAHTDTTYFTDPIGWIPDRSRDAGKAHWAFEALTQIPISAHSAGDEHTLMQPTPRLFRIIQLDASGAPVQIRFNNNDRSVLDHLTGEEVERFYAALHVWMRLVATKRNEAWVSLKPGMAVMVDNWRVLHGRAAFTGFRRLVGSYHGWDDYRSCVKMVCDGGKAKHDL